jgi:hypothetical protein
MKKYIAVRLDGTLTTHTSLAALRRAARRAKGGRVIVDHWRVSDPPPFGSAASQEWDDYRNRRGYAGCR